MLDLGLGDAAGAQAATFSIDDYGYGPPGPYQIMEPTYPAPKWLGQYVYLGQALRECQTLCTLQGRPYRVVRWGREGSGARGGVPCKPCKPVPGGARFPSHVPCGCKSNGLSGLSGCGCGDPTPLAEFRPNGQKIVFDAQGNGHVVGRPDYIVSRNPFPRTYSPRKPTQLYEDAVKTGQYLANRENKRVFICSQFGAPGCKTSPRAVPVVYVDPGGLVKADHQNPQGTVLVNPVSPEYFQELVAEGRGRSRLGWGS